MQIIDKEVNFRKDVCYRSNSENNICSITKNDLFGIMAPFLELMKDINKKVFSLDDLKAATIRVRDMHLAKIRILKKEQSGGYILISSLTSVGVLILGIIIFMAIRYMIMR